MRSGCTTAKLAAPGNARRCASGTERYWTACARGPTDITAAIGVLQVIHFGMIAPARRPVQASENESHSPENGVGLRSQRIVVPDPLIGCLEHDLGRWKQGQTKVLEAHLTGAGWQAELRPANASELAVADLLQVLIRISVKGNELPFAVQNGSERNVKCDLSGVAVHEASHIVCGIAVVVGAQVDRG